MGRVISVKEGVDGNVREAMVQIQGEKSPRRISVIRMALLLPAEEAPDRK